MKKKKYIRPEVNVCLLEAQNMLALSLTERDASQNPEDVETKERDEEFVDIWGNNL